MGAEYGGFVARKYIKSASLKEEVGPGTKVSLVSGGTIPYRGAVKFDSAGDVVVASTDAVDSVGILLASTDGESSIDGDAVKVCLHGQATAVADIRILAGEKVKCYLNGKVGPALVGSLASDTISSGTGGSFANQPANDGVEVVSSSTSDVGQAIDIWGTTNGGIVVVRERIVLNGTTQVSTVKVNWGVILGVQIVEGYPAAVGTITIREASGNATIITLAPGVRRAGVVQVTNTTSMRAMNKIVRVVASGASTKVVAVSGTDASDAELLAGFTLAGTTHVDSAVAFKTITAFLIGDLESSRTGTLKRDDTEDVSTIIGQALEAAAAGEECDILYERNILADLSEARMFRATGTIATGSVATMNATPVSVIPAPGPGKFIDVVRCHWFLDFASAAYNAAASGDTLNLKFTNGSGAAVVDAVAGDAIGAAAADYHTVVLTVPEVIPVANAAIVAHIATGEWGTGDSPLKYDILYHVRTLDFA